MQVRDLGKLCPYAILYAESVRKVYLATRT